MSKDDEGLRAAEIALGVLDPRADAVARLRMLQDPALAEEVARWERRLATLAATAPAAAPPAALFDQVLAKARSTRRDSDDRITIRADEGVCARRRPASPSSCSPSAWQP